MNFQLEHVAVLCADLEASIRFYQELFGGEVTEIRKGSAGYRFCFIRLDSALPIQLMESKDRLGAHHFGFVTDGVESAASMFREKGAKVLRESKNSQGNLTTVFLEEPSGLQIEVRLPR